MSWSNNEDEDLILAAKTHVSQWTNYYLYSIDENSTLADYYYFLVLAMLDIFRLILINITLFRTVVNDLSLQFIRHLTSVKRFLPC